MESPRLVASASASARVIPCVKVPSNTGDQKYDDKTENLLRSRARQTCVGKLSQMSQAVLL